MGTAREPGRCSPILRENGDDKLAKCQMKQQCETRSWTNCFVPLFLKLCRCFTWLVLILNKCTCSYICGLCNLFWLLSNSVESPRFVQAMCRADASEEWR